MPMGPDNTAYMVIARDDGTYAVELRKPGGLPRFTDGFTSKADAERWMFAHMQGSELPSYAGPPDSLPGHNPEPYEEK